MKRKPSLSSLKRKLDQAFSRFIRLRDANSDGFGECISCGKWAKLQAGHFVPRQFLATRWMETNVAGQCSHCNCWLHGNQAEYYLAIVKKYNKITADNLLVRKRLTVKMTRSDYEDLLERYK